MLVVATTTTGCGTDGASRGAATDTVHVVNASESEAAFRQEIEQLGHDVDGLSANLAVSTMLDFYRSTRVADVEDITEGGDMLLCQWGTYDWGRGPTFQYSITRQFILREVDESDDAIWQLSLTLHYPPDAQNAAIKPGDRWCEQPAKIEGFEEFIESQAATSYAQANTPTQVELFLEQAG